MFFNALAVWSLHHPFLTCLLDSLELSRISNFLKFQIVSDFFVATWDCNNVIIGYHIPIKTENQGGLQPPQFWPTSNLSKGFAANRLIPAYINGLH